MHHHLEVIVPPTENITGAISQVLSRFDENNNDGSGNAFWDWYQIGGRFSGKKTEALIGEKNIGNFIEELKKMKVTVSGVQFGKQTLSPETQIPMVDKLWQEMCPNGGEHCILFKHAGDKLNMDICKLSECPKDLMAYRVIIGAMDYKNEQLEAVYMRTKEIWNGVTYEKTDFSGGVVDAITEWDKKSRLYKEEYRKRTIPHDDWLVVTVDYHS